MSLFRSGRGRSGVLPALVGDLLVFLVFSAVGRSEHDLEVTLEDTLLTALPFIVMWLIIGTLHGVYASEALRYPGAAAKRTLVAWLFAAPWALLLRSVILRSPIVVVQFALITIGLNLVLLTVWRVAYAWLRR